MASWIAEPQPREVKQLVNENTREFRRVRAQFLIEDDLPFAKEGGGMHGAAGGMV